MTTRAVVLGGGGGAGIAWELGLFEGLRLAGVDFFTADLVVGTSAGAVVAVILRAGTSTPATTTNSARPSGSPGPPRRSTSIP